MHGRRLGVVEDVASRHDEADEARVPPGGCATACRRSTARDVFGLSTSPELYNLLVDQRGWTPEDFSRFVTDLMAGALLPPP